MKTTLNLSDAVARQARKRAAELGITLSALTEQALRDALAAATKKPGRIVLPTASFGPKRAMTAAELKALERD